MKNIDKLLHFLIGFYIVTTALRFFPSWIGLLLVIIIGVGKEIYDKYKGGKFDVIDFVCTIAGGFNAWWLTLVQV